MHVYLLAQTDGTVPTGNDWLCANEILSLNGMRFAKRRADWRLGRWTAKHAVASFLNLPASPRALARIEIRPASSGAPEVFVANRCLPVTISLSHRAGGALCAVAPFGVRLGCDLEVIEPRSTAFVTDYFTAEEQDLVVRTSPAEQPRILAMLWSAKESALKALREGLRLDTRSVGVRPAVGTCDLFGWSPVHVRCTDGQMFRGWWQSTGNILRTVVADPFPDPPISLRIPARFLNDAPFVMNHPA
ncbi:MAG: 4'-phosphopantetheinyl transferase superfamily protein [Terriglobales bacterium]